MDLKSSKEKPLTNQPRNQPTNLELYLTEAKEAGCPPEQLRLFRSAGYLAQPKQLRFHSAARLCDQEDGPAEIGMGGARGGAKSHALIAQMGLDDCRRRDGLKCLLLRKIGKAVRESFEDLRGKILKFVPHIYLRSSGVVKFPNGSRIILGHFKDERDIDSYLGLEYDLIGIEEATTLIHSKYKDIRTCCRSSREDWRARVYSNTNPGGVGHAWYKHRFIKPMREVNETTTRFIPSTVDDNVYLGDDYRKSLEDLTGWKKRAWRYGDWDIAAGQFFTTFRGTDHETQTHVIDPFPIPPYWKVWLTMDYGFGLTHWNMAYLLGQDLKGSVFVIDELAHRKALVPTIANDLNLMLERWGIPIDRLWRFTLGSDAFAKRGTDNRSIADQWRAEGFNPEPANMRRVEGASEMLRRFGDFESGLIPTLWVFSNNPKLIECIPSLEHDPRRPEDVLKVSASEDGFGGDDPYDALRYGIMVVSQGSILEVGRSPVADWRG